MATATLYWSSFSSAFRTLTAGLRLTLKHLVGARKNQSNTPITEQNYFKKKEGIATIRYPHQLLPVPDTGRYRLHNEIDDCIVCDLCAKICPVDCITIVPIKSSYEFGRTSDGTPKRIHAAKFDIDMGKCCFCGLCTTVCPTECLTMTKVYDFSVLDIREHNFSFSEMTQQEIEEKRKALADADAKKTVPAPSTGGAARPVFKPKIKPPGA